ncbi:hypothetical protein HPB47_022133 [Ixodes persulcatus]|uniref:Uncharacterized protein n=1 Tax=Ixodes persulcatus TaxID=34615 RepID=A0AC60QAK5_IXOPE|nr:hypothetical protein HPB47_022133 [Ixodes persulcatus]
MLSNLFCFLVQGVSVLLGNQPASYGSFQATSADRNDGLGSEPSALGHRCVIVEPFVPLISESSFAPSSGTSHHVVDEEGWANFARRRVRRNGGRSSRDCATELDNAEGYNG